MKALTKNEKLIILDALTDYHKMTEQAGETIQDLILETSTWLSEEVLSLTENRLMTVYNLRQKFLLSTHEIKAKKNSMVVEKTCPICNMHFETEIGVWGFLIGPRFKNFEGAICRKCTKKFAPEIEAQLFVCPF